LTRLEGAKAYPLENLTLEEEQRSWPTERRKEYCVIDSYYFSDKEGPLLSTDCSRPKDLFISM